MNKSKVTSHPVETITIQQTSKRLKLQLLLSSLVVIVSSISIMLAWAQNDIARGTPLNVSWQLLVIFLGFGWFSITKLRIWWHHS